MLAVLGAIEQRAPLLEFAHAFGGFLGMELGHAPVVEQLAAAHGVAEVNLPVVGRVHVRHGRSDAAFGHDGVRFAEQRFADHANPRTLRQGFNGGAQPGAAGADDEHVVFVGFVFCRSQESKVPYRAGGNQPHVKIGESHRKQADPRKQHVTFVQNAHALPRAVARAAEGGAGKAVELPSDQVTQRVAGKQIERQQRSR